MRDSRVLGWLLLSVMVLSGCTGGASSPAKPSDDPEHVLNQKLNLARGYLRSGRAAGAYETMQEVLELAPDNAGVFNFNGQICLIMGRNEEAAESFRKAIELSPLLTDAHNNLGVAYAELGRDEEAEREYLTALGDLSYPTPEKVHMNLGKLYASQGRDELALKELRSSVEQNPGYLKAHYELAGLLDTIGRLEEAASEYEVAKPNYRESGEFHFRLGWVYVRLGNTHQATEHLRRVIDLSPGSNFAAQADEILRTLE